MKKSTSTALVAESYQLFGYALKDLLVNRLDFAKVLEARDLDDARQILENTPAVSFAALDVSLPGMDGLAGIAALRVAYPELRLAVIANSQRRDDILRALSVGVHGYMPRALGIEEAVQALRTMTGGHIYVPPTLSEVLDGPMTATVSRLVAAGRGLAGDLRRELSLTARQHEVMKLIAEGRSNKQIAEQLNLAEGTVKAHVNALFKALSVHDRASVAAMATQMGEDRP